MKKIILFCLIIYIESFAQSGYNIELKKIYCDWYDAVAFIDSVETVIRDNYGNVIPPSNDFYYEYHAITDNLIGPPVEDIFGGLGLNKTFEDNDYNFIQTWYVNVKDPANQIILGTSNTVSFRMETEYSKAKQVIFQALRSNGSTESGVHAEHWMYVVNLWNPNFARFVTVNHDEVLRSSPGFLSTNNDKFNYWNSDEADILNHNHFYYEDDNTEDLIANYKTSYGGVTIQSSIDSFTGDSIEFKDPWLVDYNAPLYGMRNQGMNAPFKKVPSPFNPSLGSQYKGVLLNQEIAQNKPYYSIKIPSSIYLPNNGGAHNLYLQSWDVTGASLEDENSLETGVVFTSSSGANITANVKATQLSNDAEAYTNNSQRKFIRTPDFTPTLHTVYESMGHVWYETSTDNGQSWTLMNDGQPLDNGGGKSPSIDWVTIDGTWTYVVIVFQQTESGTGYPYSIQANVFGGMPLDNLSLYPKIQTITIYNSGYQYTVIDADPVVAMYPGADFAGIDIIWHINSGLLLRMATLLQSSYPPFNLSAYAVSVTGTNSSSIHPSLATYRVNNPGYFYLTWEENNVIKYAELYGSSVNNIQTISNFDGYTYNNNASLVVLNDSYARICWKGTRYISQIDFVTNTDNSYWETRTVFRGINNNRFWSFGQNVGSPYINKSDDQNYYAIIWNQNENSTFFADNSLRTIRKINGIPGSSVQVSNGSTKDNMYAQVFNEQSLPYYFTTSNSIGSYYSPSKITNYAFSSGREGVIGQDSAQFYFTVGDIIVDDQYVDFIEIPDSIVFNSKEVLNEYLVSETFQLSDNSNFLYSIQYGITDSSAATGLLNNSNKYISFKLQLLDAQSSEVLGTFDEVTYDQSNMLQYNNLSYQVNTMGIGDREVYLRLKVDDNFEPGYSLGEIYSTDNILAKTSFKVKNYTGAEVVESYNLSQNYPNPFNPSTIIRYQLPQDGLVTLKIYDILGREVATLVNEEKTSGRYVVNFNASSLASGVYLYRLNVNDYVNVKKMILLK